MTEEVKAYIDTGRKFRQSLRKNGYILIVEDDRAISRICMHMVKAHHHKVKWVSTVHEAKQTIIEDSNNIQCVLVDLTLPDGDGEEVVELIETEYKKLPYIVYTADREKGRMLSAKYYRACVVLKGESLDNLVDALGLEDHA